MSRFAVAVFGIALVAMTLSFFSRPDISSVAHRIAYPVWVVQFSIRSGADASLAFIRSKQSLAEENSRLVRTVATTESLRLENVILRDENESLRTMLGRSSPSHSAIASVLVRPAISPYDTLVIDVGRSAGVLSGNLVLSEAGVAIGTITESKERTSVVTLFSSPGLETQVFIGPRSLSAIALGRGGGNFQVHLPRGVEIEEGDIITMPGINPRVFAVAEKVIDAPADPMQTILFKNPVNFSEIRFVEVLLSENVL
jgi:cell shape-determining protein MreC